MAIAITASMVAELRAKTDAPMMECKKALTEAEGNFEKAEELLRVKLGSKAGKAASRVTAEGVVTLARSGDEVALVEINCETDFVTKNDTFLAFANAVAEGVVTGNPADLAALAAMPLTMEGFGPTVEDVRKGLIGKIGENMSVRRFTRFADGKSASYLHGTRIGVVVELSTDGLRQLTNHGRRHVSQQLKQHLSERFESVLLPKQWRFLEQMPINAQGKLTYATIIALFTSEETTKESRHVAS